MRRLVATAVGILRQQSAWDRPSLIDAREQVIDLFTGALVYTHVSVEPSELVREAVESHPVPSRPRALDTYPRCVCHWPRPGAMSNHSTFDRRGNYCEPVPNYSSKWRAKAIVSAGALDVRGRILCGSGG